MKHFTILFVLTYLALVVLWGCGSKGEEFIGTWHRPDNPNHYLIIEQITGKEFSVTNKRNIKGVGSIPGLIESSKHNFTFQDGKLVGPFNSSIVFSNNKLSYDGQEYIK